ncbi:probable linoleate 9S-lipoxygenase 7 isoform X2 [Tripterygium wilfordii]|uniref:probable linoleate 9S-lipoxygenase 7 isoform X2 n=1 Tax=Tripterygium wilfordii TaxID=458696 RepID=UPI0018F844A9|nr:probable linoleate 9S-lipoxygenase 7 isoform X2 [Tripterygium wilfordii]
MAHLQPCTSLQACLREMKNIITHPQQVEKGIFEGEIVIIQSPKESGPGKSASVQIYSSTKVEPNTGIGKLSRKAYLKHGKSSKHDSMKITKYKIAFHVDQDFGIPGALLITNQHKHKFFLKSASLEVFDNQTIHFDCRSWVYPFKQTKADRIFFSNTSYLPSKTPSALVELREKELKSLRGDGTGERKEWDRIYDYDYYNDLGNPDKGIGYIRPVLGGTESHPYPRRGRTGRPPCKQDSSTESQPETINFDIYVPPDERFSPKKLSEFISNSIQSTVHFLIPEAKALEQNSSSFESFDEILGLFSSNRNQTVEGWMKEKLKKLVPDELFREIVHASEKKPMEFPLPQILAENEFAWKEDEEFGHQLLAGVNPTRIRCMEVMNQWRLFILDHHDYLMPFISRINSKGVCAYASRTFFFLRNDASLKPLAIELSLPGSPNTTENISTRVFLPASSGTEAALWQLAKAHVAANDSVYHQLISHWLHTHAVVEPFIIATRRQLSAMHPIHRLLDPHFKDTMHINALARTILIKSGGIFEKTLFSGEISMELSSELYKEWRFDEQALPADLLKRRMAFKDPSNPTGAQIIFQDYPYGLDGIEIWQAIKTWVTDFCSIFYKDEDSVRNDLEIQAWWSEIRNKGHGDKCNENWWCEMTTLENLIEALTTIIWIASALHASVNFGQYAHSGYPPNRPSLCRKFIPMEGTKEFAEFLRDPEKYYFEMLPQRFEMTLGIVLAEVLSRHTSDEEYLGQRPSSEWTDNKEVQEKFQNFNANLQEIEKKIRETNRSQQLRNRWGPAKIPYKFLYPDTSDVRSKGGLTGQGIPNSIST